MHADIEPFGAERPPRAFGPQMNQNASIAAL